jgi:hypothetical protein
MALKILIIISLFLLSIGALLLIVFYMERRQRNKCRRAMGPVQKSEAKIIKLEQLRDCYDMEVK